MILKPIPRLMNASSGGGGGFFPTMMSKLPFGMSNQNNNNAATPPANPNFPSKNQLDPKDNSTDPTKQQQQQGANEPGNDPNAGQGSQLDAFADIFKLPVDTQGNPILPNDPMAGAITNLDPVKLREAASKMNFAEGLKADQLQAALSDPTGQSLLQLLQVVGRNSFTAALQGSTGIFETGIQKNNQRFEAALPDRIRSTQIAQSTTKHPALSHAAATPMVAALKSQIAATNPHLTPDKVAEMAEGYVIAMANDINNVNTQQQQQQIKKATDGPDWNALLGGS